MRATARTLPPLLAVPPNWKGHQMIQPPVVNDILLSMEDFPNPTEFVRHASARVFGHMAKLVVPVLEHYHSDLYYDAQNLQDLVTKLTEGDLAVAWEYSCSSTGTVFHTCYSTDDVSNVRRGDWSRTFAYWCQLRVVDRSWGKALQLLIYPLD